MYVYIEYPKCMYNGDQTLTVENAEEEANAAELGWRTAEEHFGHSNKGLVNDDDGTGQDGQEGG